MCFMCFLLLDKSFYLSMSFLDIVSFISVVDIAWNDLSISSKWEYAGSVGFQLDLGYFGYLSVSASQVLLAPCQFICPFYFPESVSELA